MVAQSDLVALLEHFKQAAIQEIAKASTQRQAEIESFVKQLAQTTELPMSLKAVLDAGGRVTQIQLSEAETAQLWNADYRGAPLPTGFARLDVSLCGAWQGNRVENVYFRRGKRTRVTIIVEPEG